MTARTHDMAAFTALGVVFVIAGEQSMTLSTVLVAIFANLVGGITPDIDQPTAPFWRNLPVGRYFGRIFAALNGGHRFLTHSLLGLGIFAILSHWLLVFVHPLMSNVSIDLVWRSFMIGMISHLVLDSFTKEGVPWLLPIPFKFGFPPLKRLRIVTGKKFETWVVFPGLVLLNVIFYSQHYQRILDILHRHIT